MKNQKKLGVIISYMNIVLNMTISIFFTPFLISHLGDAEYGVYRIVQSFAGQLSFMTFGIGALVTRNIAYYDVKGQKKEKENFLAMAGMISLILFFMVLVIGSFMAHFSPNVFQKSLTTPAEQQTAKTLVFLLVANIGITILSDYFAGFLKGHEKFAITNSIRTVKVLARVAVIVILLLLGFKSTAIVMTDVCLSVGILVFEIFYGRFKLKEKIKYYYFDKVMFKQSFLFSSAILLQTIINQVNQNLDGLLLGIMTDKKTVAVYSTALVIYSAYGSLTTAVSNVFVPKVTRLFAKGASKDEITRTISGPGRYQLMMAGLALSGFILFGKEFICLWINEGYLPAYKITLILIIPMTIPLIQSVCNAVLDAQLKRLARSIILVIMAGINVVVSVILVKIFGYIGAAYGTAISVTVGHIIIMNIYYYKVIDIDVIGVFKQIFHRILPCILISLVIGYPLRYINIPSALISFVVKAAAFVIVYMFIMYMWGMNKNEKALVKGIIKKVIRR